jgi:hypothetical protein
VPEFEPARKEHSSERQAGSAVRGSTEPGAVELFWNAGPLYKRFSGSSVRPRNQQFVDFVP